MAKKLTTKSIEKMPVPKQGSRTVWDASQVGFGVKITARNKRIFFAHMKFPGNKRQALRTLGMFPGTSLAQAREKATTWYHQVKQGIDPRLEEAKAVEANRLAAMLAKKTSFAAVAAEYIASSAFRAQRQSRKVEQRIRKELIPVLGETPIDKITRLDVTALIGAVRRRGTGSGAYCYNVLTNLRAVFKYAIATEQYGIEINPCARVDKIALIGDKKIRIRVLTDAELRALWLAAEAEAYPFGDLTRMLLLTGARLSEASGARWPEIDLATKTWTIPASRYKSEADHIIPISDDLMTLLEGLPRHPHGDFLFSTTQGRTPVSGFGKAKKRLDARMGISDWVYHDCRRTTRTRLSELRVPENICEAVLGHAPKGLARVYNQHRYQVEIREALDAWALRLRGIINPPPANVVQLVGVASHKIA